MRGTAPAEQIADRPRPCQRLREAVVDKIRAGDHGVDRPQTFECQRPEARPNRRADQQRAGQHRHGDRHPGDDREVRLPEVEEIPSDERREGHPVSRRCPFNR